MRTFNKMVMEPRSSSSATHYGQTLDDRRTLFFKNANGAVSYHDDRENDD